MNTQILLRFEFDKAMLSDSCDRVPFEKIIANIFCIYLEPAIQADIGNILLTADHNFTTLKLIQKIRLRLLLSEMCIVHHHCFLQVWICFVKWNGENVVGIDMIWVLRDYWCQLFVLRYSSTPDSFLQTWFWCLEKINKIRFVPIKNYYFHEFYSVF